MVTIYDCHLNIHGVDVIVHVHNHTWKLKQTSHCQDVFGNKHSHFICKYRLPCISLNAKKTVIKICIKSGQKSKTCMLTFKLCILVHADLCTVNTCVC